MTFQPTIYVPEPWYQDGKYSRDPLQISPEGFAYGSRRRFVTWTHEYWWDGSQYIEITDDTLGGTAGSKDLLPQGPRSFGEVWKVARYVKESNNYVWDTYFWDSEDDEWRPVRFYWTVDAVSDLPVPGLSVGAAHTVAESDVEVFWDGFQYRRPRHSSLDNDEAEMHLPPGFLQIMAPDVRVVYVGPREIGLEAVLVGSGQVWVNGEWIKAQKTASVLNSLAVIDWDSQGKGLVFRHAEPDVEYWIYLANNEDPSFTTSGLADDESHNAAPAWDYRGRMFLSSSSNVNGYLSDEGTGRNARLVGKIQTDTTAKAQGGPFFIRELEISLISRTTNFPETYRGYSDFQLQFSDENTLILKLLDGLYGQIAINRDLYYLGADYEISRTSAWVDWNDGDIQRHTSALSAGTLYYAYIPSMIDDLNFNAVNPNTGRPWQSSDANSAGSYDATLDLRLKPFLSPKTPEHGRLADSWPGYEVRHIGQVTTDANGKFTPARDLSAIKQPALNPTDFDGLAEIAIEPVNEAEFQVVRKRGTSGIVNVAGEGIITYEKGTSSVHKVTTATVVQDYDEESLTAPLSALDAAGEYAGEMLYVYMANSRAFWGAWAGKLFVSTKEPENGYLSRNWPGLCARWIATLIPDTEGRFTGSFISESAGTVTVTIDDSASTLTTVWSSAKSQAVMSYLTSLVSATVAFNNEAANGIPARLTYIDGVTIELTPIFNEDVTITFPNGQIGVLPAAGITLVVSPGTAYTLYYVYVNRVSDDEVSLSASTTAPVNTAVKLQWTDQAILCGYFGLSDVGYAPGWLPGYWSVYSVWNQNARTLSQSVNQVGSGGGHLYTYCSYDAVVVPPIHSASFIVDGNSTVGVGCQDGSSYFGCQATANTTPGYDSCSVPGETSAWVQREKSQANTLTGGVYAASTLYFITTSSGACIVNWYSFTVIVTGTMFIQIEGN